MEARSLFASHQIHGGGNVDENVKPSVPANAGIDHVDDVPLLAHIPFMDDGFTTFVDDVVGDALHTRAGDIRDNHRSTFCGQAPGAGRAEVSGGSGDEGDFSF